MGHIADCAGTHTPLFDKATPFLLATDARHGRAEIGIAEAKRLAREEIEAAMAELRAERDKVMAQVQAAMPEVSRQTLAETPQDLGEKSTEEQIKALSDDNITSIFDEVEAETAPSVKPQKQPRKAQGQTATADRAKKNTPKAPTKKATTIAKEGGIAARKAAKDALAGLAELFGDPNTLRSGLTFDEETYKKAKPHFVAAWLDVKDVGYSVKELVRYFYDAFGNKIRPYLERFVRDVRDGKLEAENQLPNENLTDAPQGDTIEGQGGGTDANRQKQGDLSGTIREDGDTTEADSDRALGGLEAEGGQTTDSGEPPTVGGTESGEAGTRGDKGTDGGRVPTSRGGRGGATKVHTSQAGGKGKKQEKTAPRIEDTPGNIPAANFVITEEVGLGQGGETVKYNDNIAAIKTLKTLQREQRRATADEQRTLARYVGWGGLANAFKNIETGEIKAGWEQRVAELEALLSPEELAVARSSTSNAHYTSKAVIDGMWSALRHLGFKGGNALEPSVGTGNFIGLVPPELAGSTNFLAVEYENITAGIAANLYPQATVLHSGFERVPIPDNSFDLVIGNPPFGQDKLTFPGNPHLSRHTIHNQFFLAGIDALRPGGIQAMVVSRYLMDGQDTTVRELLAKEANLLGVVRLPETAFKENARTEVITDIIFLQKKTELERNPPPRFDDKGKEIPPPPYVNPSWVYTRAIPDPLGGDDMTVNRYFVDTPEAILGTMDRSGSMRFGADITVKLPAGANLASLLEKRLKDILPHGIATRPTPADKAKQAFDNMVRGIDIVMNGFEDGNVMLSDLGVLEQIVEQENPGGDWILSKRALSPDSPWSPSIAMNADGKWFREVDKLDDKGNKIKAGNRNVKTRQVFESEKDLPANMKLGEAGYKALKDAVTLLSDLYEQIRLEINNAPEVQIEQHRKKLRKGYNGFVAEHGHLHAKTASRVIAGMPNSALLYSLEAGYKAPLTKERAAKLGTKPRPAVLRLAAILNERVNFPYEKPEKAENPTDALAIVLSETGFVDLDRLGELLDTDAAGVTRALHDDMDTPLIFLDPETKRWETPDEYLGGHVVRKLQAARAANLGKNVIALEKVQPAPWGADKVTPIFGASWIPATTYSDFITHITGSTGTVRFNAFTNSFAVHGDYKTVRAQQWNTEHRSIIDIAESALNSKPIKVYRTNYDGSREFLQEATELAIEKSEELKREFDEWVFLDSDRRRNLVELFNAKYNVRVLKQRNGQHLKLPGAVPTISMRRHQKNAIWRGVVDRVVLFDHAVGSGKTYTSIARAMERRRMGLSKKPMMVVPNHIVEQFASAAYRLYPGAKILTAGREDMSASKRRRVFAKIATGDWDMVIVPHSSFGFIGIDKETEQRYLDEQLVLSMAAVEEAWDEAELDGYDRERPRRKPHTVKEAERVLEKIKGRLTALRDRNDSRDRLLTFEQLGVDDLTVDEAHEFKNLFYNSSLNVRGMNPKQGSNKAYDLWTKTRVLRESPTGSIAFMTGTPISNSAVEMYGLMRYLIPDMLADAGLEHFDSWRNSFTTVSSGFEYTEAGTGTKEVSRLGRDWANMRLLMDMYYTFSDSVSNDDISQWYAEDHDGAKYPLPNVKNGGRTPVVTKPTPAQRRILDEIIEGFNDLPNERDPKVRNAERLRLMDRARKLSLDARAVDPHLATTEEGGKLQAVTENALRIYKDWKKDKGTQLIFLDRSIAKEKGHTKLLAEYDALIRRYEEADQKGDEEAARKIVDKLEKFDPATMEEIRTAQAGGWNAYQQIRDNLIAGGVPEHEIKFIGEADTDIKKKDLFDEFNAGQVRFIIGSTSRMGAGTNVQHRLVGLHHVDVGWKPSDIEQREGRIIRQGNELYKKYGEDFEVEILAYVTENSIDAKMWALNSTKLKMINGIRNYKGEFNMEFEDEDAVGMAEIAAIASGEPLQLEQVQLATEIDRLDRLKAAHRKQIFGAKDEFESRKKQIELLPKQIEVLEKNEKVISAARVDAMRPSAGWTVNINGIDYNREALRDGTTDKLLEGIKAEAIAVAEAKAPIIKNADGTETRGKRPPSVFAVEINGEKVRSLEKAKAIIIEELGDGLLVMGELDGTAYREKKKLARAIEAKVNEHTLEGNTEGELGTVTIDGTEVELSYQQVETINESGKGYETTVFLELDDKASDGSRVSIAYARDVSLSPSPHKMTEQWSLSARISDIADSLRDIGRDAARLKARLRANEEALPELEKAANKPFAREQELTDKRARLKEVEDQLSSRGAPQAPLAQSEQNDGTEETNDDKGAVMLSPSAASREKGPAPAGSTVPAMEVIGERTDARAKRDMAALAQAVNEARTGKKLSFTAVDVSAEATKRARRIASLFGKRVVFFRGTNPAEDPGGVTVRTAGNTLFVNVASGYSDMAIIGHELLHHLKAQHPDIYDRLKDSILALAKDSAVGDYQARLQRVYDNTGTGTAADTALAEEELIADFIGDRFTEASFWDDLAGSEPSLFRRVAKAIKTFLENLLAKFRGIAGFKTDPLFADLQAARKAAVTAIAEYSRREKNTGRNTEESSTENAALFSPTATQAAGLPPNLADLSPAMQQIAEDIKQMMAARKVQARQGGERVKVAKTAGHDVLEKLKTKAGNISRARAIKRFQGYEEMKAKLLNDKVDIEEKLRLLADYVRKFPREVRGTLNLESFPSRIAAAKTERRRLSLIRSAMIRIDEAHEGYSKRTAIKELLSIIKKNEPQLKGNITRQTRGGYSLYGELKAIKATLKMDAKAVEARIDDLNRKAGQEDFTFDEVLELRRLMIYGRLYQSSAAEVAMAVAALKETVAAGNAAWKSEMEELRQRRTKIKNEVVRVVSGGQEKKDETEQQKDLQGMAKAWRRAKDAFRAFDDKHQSFEWILDKLSRFDTTSKLLDSPLVKTFSPLVKKATTEEQTGTGTHRAILNEKMVEIYGKEGRDLEKQLNQNSVIESSTGVFRRVDGKRGEEIPLSQNQAYKRWMEYQDPTLREQLTKQGYTEATMVEIESFMSDEVMEWAQWQLEDFYPAYYGGVNEVFKQIFFTDMPFNPKYSPIRRAYAKGQEDQNLLQQETHYSSVINGSVRNRVDNHRDIELQDGDSALAIHIAQMEHFKAWANPMRELRGTLGGERVRQAIKDFHGPAALKTLNGFLDDFARGKSAELVDTPMLQKFRGNFITAVLGVNPVVFFKQLTGIPAFAAEIPAGQWVKNLPKTPGEWITAWKEMGKSEVLRARFGDGFERDLIAAMSSKVPGKMAGTRKIAAKLMFFVRYGDKATATIGGWPVYKYHLAKNLKEGMSEDQAKAEAMEKFELAIERTQGSGNIKDMSAYQRGGEVARLFTMFMTTPTTFYRQMSGATRELQKSIALSKEAAKPGIEPTKAEEMRREAAKMRMDAARRLVVIGIVLPVVFQFVAGAGFDDDDTLREIALGPMNGLFMLRDVATGVYDYSAGRPVFDSPGTPPPLSTMGELHTAVSKIMKKWRSDEWLVDEDFWKIIKSTGTVAGNLTGIPVGPVARLAEGVHDAATGNTVSPGLRALGYSEYRLDAANRAYMDLRRVGLARKETDPTLYKAVAAQDERRAAMRKRLKTLQENGADRESVSAARMRIKESNQAFVDKWGSRA
jgi:N12 class adenine-specific DNA methylase